MKNGSGGVMMGVKAALVLFAILAAAGCMAEASPVEEPWVDASRPLVLSEFLLLVSGLEEGAHLDLAAGDPGVVSYRGGALPAPDADAPWMYTFSTTFSLDLSLRSERLSLYTGISEFPFRVYLNGVEMLARGRYRDGHYNSSLRAAVAAYLSPDLLRYGTSNSLVIEAYPRFETWELDLPWLGRSDDVARAVFRRNFVGINLVQATIVISAIMCLYVLALYFLAPERKPSYLWFSLLCVAFCAAYLNVVVHNEALPEVPLEALSKACMVLSSTFLLVFILEYAGPFGSRRAKAVVFGGLILAGTAAACVILTRTSKADILAAFGPAMNLVIFPELVCGIACVSWAFFVRRNRLVAPLFAAICAVLATAVHDIVFLNSSRLPYAWFTPYGYFAYILAIFAMLTIDQAKLYRLSLTQADELRAGQLRIEKLNREITRQRDSFLRFVPTQFLQLLGKDSALDIRLGDTSLRFLSVLYSDVRRYAGVSGSNLPDRAQRSLNDCLRRMEAAIQNHHGFVDKYIGDAVLALFPYEGEPVGVRKSLSADHAVQTASEIGELLEEMNAVLRSRGEAGMDLGIGIDTGEVVLGTVGSESRLDTSVVGETVTVATRLEGLAMGYHARVLVSGATRAAMVYPERFDFRLVDRVSVAGRREGMELYELLDGDGEPVRRKLASRERLEEARRAYDEGRFEEAAALFGTLAADEPADPLPRLFAERCAAFAVSPPPAGWNGMFHYAVR